jgi:hypothetical protein
MGTVRVTFGRPASPGKTVVTITAAVAVYMVNKEHSL